MSQEPRERTNVKHSLSITYNLIYNLLLSTSVTIQNDKTMQQVFKIFFLILLFQACANKSELNSNPAINWKQRTVKLMPSDSLTKGKTYLSVYSQIYSQTEHTTHNLTATVSMRNINIKDTVYIKSAEYFDTHGNAIRTYFDTAIFIAPMETVEIIIEENDQEGGTGANFLFEWAMKPNSNEPFFEAVMISTSGQQGLSFTTQGRKINE